MRGRPAGSEVATGVENAYAGAVVQRSRCIQFAPMPLCLNADVFQPSLSRRTMPRTTGQSQRDVTRGASTALLPSNKTSRLVWEGNRAELGPQGDDATALACGTLHAG